MLTFIKLLKCRKCPYHQGNVKFNESPCVNCKVNGGKEPPPEMKITVKRQRGGHNG